VVLCDVSLFVLVDEAPVRYQPGQVSVSRPPPNSIIDNSSAIKFCRWYRDSLTIAIRAEVVRPRMAMSMLRLRQRTSITTNIAQVLR